VQPIRRATEVQFLGDRDEVTEVAEFHGRAVRRNLTPCAEQSHSEKTLPALFSPRPAKRWAKQPLSLIPTTMIPVIFVLIALTIFTHWDSGDNSRGK
jgi:hypothetical protein